MSRPSVLYCRKESLPVSSRSFVFLVPVRRDRRLLGDVVPMNRSGSTIRRARASSSATARCSAVVFIAAGRLLDAVPGRAAVALHGGQESFHPKLPPMKRGGPEDYLTLEQYKSFFIQPADGAMERHPYVGVRLLDRHVRGGDGRSTSRSAIRSPITWPRPAPPRRCAC